MVKLIINKGFFYGAGSLFKWTPEHHIHGVGIAERYFRENRNGTIGLVISGKEYTLDIETGLAFVKKYKSIEKRGGIEIGVVSRDILVHVSSETTNKLF